MGNLCICEGTINPERHIQVYGNICCHSDNFFFMKVPACSSKTMASHILHVYNSVARLACLQPRPVCDALCSAKYDNGDPRLFSKWSHISGKNGKEFHTSMFVSSVTKPQVFKPQHCVKPNTNTVVNMPLFLLFGTCCKHPKLELGLYHPVMSNLFPGDLLYSNPGPSVIVYIFRASVFAGTIPLHRCCLGPNTILKRLFYPCSWKL